MGEAFAGRLTTAAKKGERSVSDQIRILLDFVGSVLKTSFHGVIAPGLGNRIAGLQGVVDLDYKEGFRAGRKRIEVQRFHPGIFGRTLNDALAAGSNALV